MVAPCPRPPPRRPRAFCVSGSSLSWPSQHALPLYVHTPESVGRRFLVFVPSHSRSSSASGVRKSRVPIFAQFSSLHPLLSCGNNYLRNLAHQFASFIPLSSFVLRTSYNSSIRRFGANPPPRAISTAQRTRPAECCITRPILDILPLPKSGWLPETYRLQLVETLSAIASPTTSHPSCSLSSILALLSSTRRPIAAFSARQIAGAQSRALLLTAQKHT